MVELYQLEVNHLLLGTNVIAPLQLMLPVEGVEAWAGGKRVEGSNCVVVRPVDHP